MHAAPREVELDSYSKEAKIVCVNIAFDFG